jgi:hypothetical protein
VRRNALLIDVGIAALVAILVIVIAPGLAVVGLLAILVLIVCAVSFALDRRRKRSREDDLRELRRSRAALGPSARRSSSRRPPPRRPPPRRSSTRRPPRGR